MISEETGMKMFPKEAQDQCWGLPGPDQKEIWAEYGFVLSGLHRIYVPWRI